MQTNSCRLFEGDPEQLHAYHMQDLCAPTTDGLGYVVCSFCGERWETVTVDGDECCAHCHVEVRTCPD
jgi:hypothetical protein